MPQMFLEERARRYIDEITSGETPPMARVREACEREGQPCIPAETGRVLRTLALAVDARRVLEIGALVGYSAMWLADAVGEEGLVETVELDPTLAEEARANLREAGLERRVRVHVGNAADVLPRLEGPYDLVFIDADKRQYLYYLREALRLTRPRGVIAADNLLWSGRVYDPASRDDETNALRQYAKAVVSNPNLSSTILPVGDGLGVSVVLP